MRTSFEIPTESQGEAHLASQPLLREVFNCCMVNPFGISCSKQRQKKFAVKSSTSTPKKTTLD